MADGSMESRLANFFSVPIDYLADDSLDDPNESAMSIQEHAIQVVLKKRGIKDVFLLDSDLRTRDLEPEKFKEHMKDLWADFQNIQLHLLMSEMRRTKDFRQPIIKVTPENDRTGDSSSVSSDSAAVPVRYRRLLLPKTPSPPEDEGKPRSSSLHPAPPNEPPKDASQQEQFHKAPLAILKGGKRPEGEDSAAPKKNKPASKK